MAHSKPIPPLSLTIQGYGTNGEGVARLPDGMAVFLPGAMKGETCLVQVDKVGRQAAWGHVLQVETPSPFRIESDCPYYVNCGGCVLRHMTYDEELAFKGQKVQDCLTRIGGCSLPVSAIYGAKNTERYRNKVQFPISGSSIGFYDRGTHRVTDVADCLLQPESCSRLRQALFCFMSTYHIPAYDETTGTGLLRHLYVRTNRAGESLCCVLVNGKSLPREESLVTALRQAEPNLKGIVLGVNEKKNNVILGDSYRTLWGQDYLMDQMCGLTFRLSVPSFYQVNTPQAEVLYDLALELAGLTGEETALDLYCGIGTITLCLARRAKRAIGAEIVPQAIADAKENAARNGLHNTEFFCGDAADIAAAKNGLIRAVLEEARSIRKKYVSPPHTTDFAILFVPSEGLYAMLAAEDLLYTLQRDEKILLCGPSTLAALLNSLQVGFQTLAIEQQSGEILKLLSAVKKSFGSFSANLESTRRSIHAAANNLERAAGNSRSIQQKLRAVAEADIYEAQALLGEEFVLEEKEENHED